jgi:UDPglucose 6-dehydrogenase
VTAAFRKVEVAVWNQEGKRVALLGLAFKEGTDDVRFSPALGLAQRLLQVGARVVGYDPQAGANARADLPELEDAEDPYASLEGTHLSVVCTDWDELREVDPAKMAGLMAAPAVVDGRNLLDADAMVTAGFTYLPTGRPPVRP